MRKKIVLSQIRLEFYFSIPPLTASFHLSFSSPLLTFTHVSQGLSLNSTSMPSSLPKLLHVSQDLPSAYAYSPSFLLTFIRVAQDHYKVPIS